MSTRYYTTPIYYVNAEPHLGHSFTSILVDVFTRFHRQWGEDVRFLTGTDEHGEKIAQSAARQSMTPQAFVDGVSQIFRDAWPVIEVSPDDFIRTTEPRHKQVVAQMLTDLYARGEIYKGTYQGLYCVGCERFLTEKELTSDGNCPDHGIPPKLVSEENYMFKMEQHREWLRELLERRPEFIRPDRYRSEVLAILREPIGDLSISRPASRVSWGIPIPWDAEHVVYVWFDALLNYVSALGGPGDELFERYWASAEHVVGKDILKQHGIFWPIMLKAMGLPLFRGLLVHGHWLVDQAKMSKSLGNVIRPHAMATRYGADAYRYFLMRDMVFGSDADFSELALASRLNSDLANDLGNLLSRVLTMLGRYCDGRIPSPEPAMESDQGLLEMLAQLPERVKRLVDELQVHAAIEEILQSVRKANQYLQERAPWTLAKDPAQLGRIGTILYSAAETLRLAAVLLYPVIPVKSVELLRQLGCSGPALSGEAWTRAWGHLPVGQTLAPGEILFPKIDLALLKTELQGETAGSAEKSNPKKAGKAAVAAETTKPTVKESESVQEHQETAADSLIGIEDFQKVQLRVAEVVAAEPVPKAKKLLKLTLQAGDITRTVVSGIAEHYTPESLVGKKVVVVWNLKPVVLRGVESQGMILAAEDATGQLSLVGLDRDLPSGGTVR